MKLTNCSQITLIADQKNVMGGRWGLIPWAQPNNFSRDTVPLSSVVEPVPDFFAGAGADENEPAPAPGCCCVT